MTAATDFWRWAVTAYGRPGVSEICLELQDAHGQNVPLLLFGAWCAIAGLSLDDETVEAAQDTARVWDESAVAPLRAVRRRLKQPLIDMDAEAREAVRAQVKAVELEAERRLMADLAALVSERAAPRAPLPELVRVSRGWSESVPRSALALLADRLAA